MGATAAYRTELSMAMTVEEVVVVVQLRAILNAGEREREDLKSIIMVFSHAKMD